MSIRFCDSVAVFITNTIERKFIVLHGPSFYKKLLVGKYCYESTVN